MTDGQTEHLKRAFLQEFAKQGNVSRACKAAKVGRTTVYEWRADVDFEARYREAELAAVDVLEAEAWKRAVTGRQTVKRKFARAEALVVSKDADGAESAVEGVTDGLVLVEEERSVTVSDGLLTLLLKAHAPQKYRERLDVKHQTQTEDDADLLSPDDRERIRQLLIGGSPSDRGDLPASP